MTPEIPAAASKLIGDLRDQIATLSAALARTINERDYWRERYQELVQDVRERT